MLRELTEAVVMEMERQAQIKETLLRGHPFDEQELLMVTPEM